MSRLLLLVEENELVARAMVRLLSEHYRVSWTRIITDAVRVVGTIRFDVVLCGEPTRPDLFALLETTLRTSPRTIRVAYGATAPTHDTLVSLCHAVTVHGHDVPALLATLSS